MGSGAAGSAFGSGIAWSFGVDPLTGFFLAALAVSGVPAMVFAAGYLPGTRGARAVGVLTAGFVLALVGVLTARTALGFLTFWELMTLLPAGAILVVREGVRARRSVFEYLAITHLGGVGVWVSLLLLAHLGALGDPAAVLARGRRPPSVHRHRRHRRFRHQGRASSRSTPGFRGPIRWRPATSRR